MTLSADLNTIQVNGVEYVRKDSVSSASVPTGNREVVVIDRGWIYAGNVTEDPTGMLTITNAVHVFRWESVGFTGVIENPDSDKVTLKKMSAPVLVPSGSVIYRVLVPETWGANAAK